MISMLYTDYDFTITHQDSKLLILQATPPSAVPGDDCALTEDQWRQPWRNE